MLVAVASPDLFHLSLPYLLSGRPPESGKYVVLYFYPLDFTFVCPVGTDEKGC